MAPKTTTSTEVEIFGATYRVRGEQDRERLQELADIVDRRMHEISRHLPVADSGKIAVLAALNLADELLQCQSQQEGDSSQIMDKVTRLTDELDEALQAP